MFIALTFARTSGITHPQQCFPFQSKEFMSRNIVLYLDVTRPCTIFLNFPSKCPPKLWNPFCFWTNGLCRNWCNKLLAGQKFGKAFITQFVGNEIIYIFYFSLKAWNAQPNTSGSFYLLSEFHFSCSFCHLVFLSASFLCCTCQGENPAS